MINTQKIEVPNTDTCAIVTSVSFIHSHTFDASKMYIIYSDKVDEIETQIKEKLMKLATHNKRTERSVIVEVLKQNARFMLTRNVK